nr:hypothetical protein [Tanacetum cinerariifolium]
PPSPGYIPGPEYPEYLPSADDMLPAEEQPLPVAVSPTAESPGYFMESEPERDCSYTTTFGYRIAARISVQPHILMPFRSESEIERLLAIPTPPLSPVSLTSYILPPLLTSFPIYTPLPTSSFLLPSSIPSSSGRYEIGESSVAAAARQIMPTLTIAESRRADGKLIGRLKRERRYFRTMATHYVQE